ncbi:MAG: M23 family metallopeptidase [Gemmatimonadota bacterium]|nr:M23 family metallopeptidase [Gemmatimonadota bacterium]
MTPAGKRWEIRFVRADGRRAHTWSATRPRMTAGFLGGAALIVFLGFLLGGAWERRAESARTQELESEVASLRREAGRVAELAERLTVIERDYSRLQAAVTEGAPSPGPTLPPAVAFAAGMPDEGSVAAPAWPLAQRGFVTRLFGSRDDGSLQGHPGIDIAVPSGSYVRAMRAGTVEEAGEDEIYGRYIRIAHGDGLSSLYGHNSWLFVQPGDSVQRLQVIALTGNTGRSTAPHLHFELTRDGELLDPLAFVNQGGGEATVGARGAGVEQR